MPVAVARVRVALDRDVARDRVRALVALVRIVELDARLRASSCRGRRRRGCRSTTRRRGPSRSRRARRCRARSRRSAAPSRIRRAACRRAGSTRSTRGRPGSRRAPGLAEPLASANAAPARAAASASPECEQLHGCRSTTSPTAVASHEKVPFVQPVVAVAPELVPLRRQPEAAPALGPRRLGGLRGDRSLELGAGADLLRLERCCGAAPRCGGPRRPVGVGLLRRDRAQRRPRPAPGCPAGGRAVRRAGSRPGRALCASRSS